MDDQVFQLQSEICKVFSHPKRLQILCLLKAGEQGFQELQEATGLSKANLSQHLGLLRQRGVVLTRRDGQHLYFRIANPKITQACELMHDVLCEQIAERQRVTESSQRSS